MSDHAARPADKLPQTNSSLQLSPLGSEQSLIGRQLGQYKLVEKIGQGGMGAVFKAHDTALDRPVALKTLFTSPFEDAKQCERFAREARSLARLNHPNLLHVYNVGAEGDYHYFAMELLLGATLAQEIRRRRRIPTQETILWISQLLSALRYIHQHGIMHRDIKSQNIMLCDRRVVLMDFGLAKDDNFSGLTSVGVVLGTPDYISPEAVEGISAGPPTDIYSLGVVMYEMLTGALPFVGKSALSIIRQHLDVAPPSIERALPDIHPLLAKIVHRCLAKKSTDRYPNCPALARELIQVYSTPELIALVEETNGGGRVMSSADDFSKSRSNTPLMPLDPQVAAAELQVSLRKQHKSGPVAPSSLYETMALAPNSAPLAPADEITALTPNYATVALKPAISPTARRRSPWIWVALGSFGILLFVTIFFYENRRHKVQKIQKTPPSEWTGQIVSLRALDGSIQKYRWIEFKANDPDPKNWHHVVEQLRSDGKGNGMRTQINHDDFIKNASGRSLDFL
ncbi:MAG: serine/threonine-protein kinase [Planctomycetota bacterium]